MRLTFYVGTEKDKLGKDIASYSDVKGLRNDATCFLSRRFGGVTVQEGNGGWIDNNTLICEKCLIFTVESEKDISHFAVPTAEFLRELYSQSAVCVSRTHSLVSFI